MLMKSFQSFVISSMVCVACKLLVDCIGVLFVCIFNVLCTGILINENCNLYCLTTSIFHATANIIHSYLT